MQSAKINGDSTNAVLGNHEPLESATLRLTQTATVEIGGDAFGREAKLQTLQFQAAQTRYGLFLAQAQTGSGSLYAINPKTFNDPVIGQYTAGQRNVSGAFANPSPNPAFPAPGDPAAKNDADNGKAFRVVARNANANRPPVLYVNGINTDLARATRTAAEISRLTGAPVDLAYNSSSVTVAVSKSLDHFENVARSQASAAAPKFLGGKAREEWIKIDTARRVAVFANGPQVAAWAKRNMLQNPPTAQTTANLIAEQLRKTNDAVDVVAYSQGGAITVEALNLLRAQGVDVSRVRVLAIAAAATRPEFPSNVAYSGYAHQTDPVAQYFGENRRGFNVFGTGGRQFLDRGEQHSNYFRVTTDKRADGTARALLQNWYRGGNFGFRLLPDVR